MAKEGTYSTLYSYGDAINERSLSVAGYITSPTWEPEVAAIYGGIAAREYSIDPARPLQSLEMVGMLPPPVTRRWTLDQVNALLYQGISPIVEEGGAMRIKRSITTHQVNADNGLDTSYLDSTRMPSLGKYIRMRRQLIASRYGRHKVAPDGTTFGAGQVVVTPSMMRGDLIVQYKEMERAGLVQGTESFIESLIVELNENDPSRMDILDTPIFVSPLAVAAVKVEFRL
jgi:phage tail sheath gpL-like